MRSLSMSEQLSPNFTREEFACSCNCGFDDISILLVEKLQDLREELGRPVKITSGCRCASLNREVGGASESAHLSGFAVDIACSNSPDRMRIIPTVCRIFRRIGISNSFIHVDVDGSKDQDVIWTY